MRFSLINLEKQLSNFFENRLAFFSERNSLIPLTELLVTTLEQNIIELGGQKVAPNIFHVIFNTQFQTQRISLHHWADEVVEFIKKVIAENELATHGPIVVNVEWKDDMDVPFYVVAKHTIFRSGNTIRINDKEAIKAEATPVSTALLIFNNGEQHTLKKGRTSIGRAENNDLTIDNLLLSRHHARITVEKDLFVISDLDSTTGTFVNGNKIHSHILLTGDVITLGDVSMIFMSETEMLQDNSGLTKKIDFE